MVDSAEASFACALVGLAGRGEGNFFLSPTSLRVAFGLLYAGARGRTAIEMREVLSFGTQEDTSRRFARVLGALAASAARTQAADTREREREAAEQSRMLPRVVSRLWPAVGRPLAEEFARVARDTYGAPLASALPAKWAVTDPP
jgi:hypothetical protein